MQVDLAKLEKKIDRIANMLSQVLHKVPEETPKRLTEKQVIEQYNVSIHMLRKMRLGYKNNKGIDVPPVLFHWGHRNGRHIDYDVAELDTVFKRTIL